MPLATGQAIHHPAALTITTKDELDCLHENLREVTYRISMALHARDAVVTSASFMRDLEALFPDDDGTMYFPELYAPVNHDNEDGFLNFSCLFARHIDGIALLSDETWHNCMTCMRERLRQSDASSVSRFEQENARLASWLSAFLLQVSSYSDLVCLCDHIDRWNTVRNLSSVCIAQQSTADLDLARPPCVITNDQHVMEARTYCMYVAPLLREFNLELSRRMFRS